jgi:hypothetical protein
VGWKEVESGNWIEGAPSHCAVWQRVEYISVRHQPRKMVRKGGLEPPPLRVDLLGLGVLSLCDWVEKGTSNAPVTPEHTHTHTHTHTHQSTEHTYTHSPHTLTVDVTFASREPACSSIFSCTHAIIEPCRTPSMHLDGRKARDCNSRRPST